MLKKQIRTPFVTLFNSSQKKYYWVPPNSSEYNKLLSFTEQNKNKNLNKSYDLTKMHNEIEIHNNNIKELKNQLTIQTKLIEETRSNMNFLMNGLTLSSYIFLTFNLTRIIFNF